MRAVDLHEYGLPENLKVEATIASMQSGGMVRVQG
jgi:hypothetical protein